MSNKKKVAFHNLGCKVNSYETDAMQQLLIDNGYEIVPFEPGADIYIINTCTVTNMADRKSRQMLHKAKKMNKNAIVVAAGCYAQVALEDAKADAGVDIIIGNNKKHEIVEILAEYTGNEKVVAHFDINKEKTEYETLSIDKTAEHTRAYIKIQDGCNQFCSYCLIPFARGRVRSRRPDKVIEEVKALVKNGYREVVLTGIHVSSYGMDFQKKEYESIYSNNKKSDVDSKKNTEEQDDAKSLHVETPGKDNFLLDLLKQLNSIDGLDRIRLSSLEPRVMTEQFVQEISKLEKICGHFHLSLQSGSEATLKRMNRHYSPEEYEKSCEYLNKYFEHPALTTDVIVGFPGETTEEFLESKEFVENIRFYETHIFKYSKRKGTRAAVMDNQVDEKIKTTRSNELLALNKQRKKEFMEYYIGKNKEILVEEELNFNNEIYQIGHTKEYIKVAVKCPHNMSNELVSGEITGFLTDDIMEMELN